MIKKSKKNHVFKSPFHAFVHSTKTPKYTRCWSIKPLHAICSVSLRPTIASEPVNQTYEKGYLENWDAKLAIAGQKRETRGKPDPWVNCSASKTRSRTRPNPTIQEPAQIQAKSISIAGLRHADQKFLPESPSAASLFCANISVVTIRRPLRKGKWKTDISRMERSQHKCCALKFWNPISIGETMGIWGRGSVEFI